MPSGITFGFPPHATRKKEFQQDAPQRLQRLLWPFVIGKIIFFFTDNGAERLDLNFAKKMFPRGRENSSLNASEGFQSGLNELKMRTRRGWLNAPFFFPFLGNNGKVSVPSIEKTVRKGRRILKKKKKKWKDRLGNCDDAIGCHCGSCQRASRTRLGMWASWHVIIPVNWANSV